jgi:hypothetical protein
VTDRVTRNPETTEAARAALEEAATEAAFAALHEHYKPWFVREISGPIRVAVRAVLAVSPAVTEGERAGRRVPPPNYALAETVSDELGVRAAPSPAVTAAEDETGLERITSWEQEGACHGAHMVQPGHWTMEPHHYLRCHSPAPVVAAVPAEPRSLTVMRAHEAKDCPDRDGCWAADIHDKHSPRVPADPNEKD